VEENLWDGYPEETNAPYGLAKKMLLCMSQAYRQQYGCNFVFLLPVNMYGPNDSFDLETCHVIPAMIKRFHEAKVNQAEKVTLWGDGCPTREFLYVDDCAKAIIATMEKYDDPEPINIGTGQEISMRNLASTIKNIVQYNGTTCWDTSMPNGQPRRCLDVTRASKLLGWKADTSLNEGLVKTYEWYESKGISLD
jgi:GDP-L-fucose synthase